MRLVYTADLHGDIEGYRALLDLAVSAGARAAIVGGDLLPRAIKLDRALEIQRSFVAAGLRPLLAEFRAAHPDIAVYLLAGNDDWAAAIASLDDLERAGLAFPLHERVYALTPQPPLPRGERGCSSLPFPRGESRGSSLPFPRGESRGSSLPFPRGERGGSSLPSPALGEGPGVREEPGLWLAGYACVPLTPFSIKDYERRDDGPLPESSFDMAYASWGGEVRRIGADALAGRPSIAEALALLAERSDPRRTIYVCHAPPAGTPLDLMPRGRHVGSRAVRGFVERYAPPLTLHGHIHEAPWLSGQYACRVGDTWSVNPGNDQRRFHAVALDTDDIAGTMSHTIFGRLSESLVT